jgi:hypothetical protein
MDFQPTEHVTETPAIGNDGNTPPEGPELSTPQDRTHAALQADMEFFYNRLSDSSLFNSITHEINRSIVNATAPLHQTIANLNAQVSTLNNRVIQIQQQTLHNQTRPQQPAIHTTNTTTTTPRSTGEEKGKKTRNNTGKTNAATSDNEATNPPTAPAENTNDSNTRGGETVDNKKEKKKKTVPPKLIPTIYPQAEREVKCHFASSNDPEQAKIHAERSPENRQQIADTALRRVNAALIDNKDVTALPFIRARVSMKGSIIFTTSNIQNNIIYEDYTGIIGQALTYYDTCEQVEIGKRFSQFLLHGVPTHLSIPEIASSIATNYPQLVQGQTPRWLTPADRRVNKTDSTIVMTLTGDIKKAAIGRQHLIICNRECRLQEYIAYGRSTQCRNCQIFGHPAALCRNEARCAVCVGVHETKNHPCAFPNCKMGPACTHPPIRCANCNNPHKASDPNCPERIKVRLQNSQHAANTTNNKGDAPEAWVAV